VSAVDLPLVVAVDGSEPSLRAVDWAADEASLRGVPLRLVYASLWERYEGTSLVQDASRPSEQVMADGIVATAARRAARRQAGVKITTDVRPEEPEYALVSESRDASALVMGARGRSGVAEMLLGSVSLAVAARADCPVVVLRGGQDRRGGPETHGRIVVGVGEGPAGSAAVRFAAAEAELRGVPLEAVRAWRHPAHPAVGDSARLHEERAAETLEAAVSEAAEQHPGVDLRRRTVEGHARRVLLDVSRDAGLLVVGARRTRGSFGLQLGRVTHGVLHYAACPVAVVPHRA
jgi:nucleotide-binding universal stress UspA family protein